MKDIYVTRRHRDGFECQLPKEIADRMAPGELVTPDILAEALKHYRFWDTVSTPVSVQRKSRNPWENV